MASFNKGERVNVSGEVKGNVICDHLDNIAGKEAFVKTADDKNQEAFVVKSLDDEDGTFVPYKFLEHI